MDLDRGGHARHEHRALRNRFELDAQGDALRQAHPREDRVRRRDALVVRLRVRDPGAAMVLDVQLRDYADSTCSRSWRKDQAAIQHAQVGYRSAELETTPPYMEASVL